MSIGSGSHKFEDIEARAHALSKSIQQPLKELERQRHVLRLATGGGEVFLTQEKNREIRAYTGVAAKVRRAAYSMQRTESELANKQLVLRTELTSRVHKLEIAIKREIHAFVEEIDEKVKNSTELSPTQEQAIQNCFFNVLGKLPEDVFKRSIVKPGSKLEQILAEGVERVEAKELQTRRVRYEKAVEHDKQLDEAKATDRNAQKLEGSDAEKKKSLVAISEAFIDFIESESLFAIALGIQPESGGDASTMFITRDRSGKRLGGYKPYDMGSRAPNNPKISGLKRVWAAFRTDVLGHQTTRQARKHRAQVLTDKASKRLGVFMTAPSKISKIASATFGTTGKVELKTGSLQAWVPEARLASDVLNVPSGVKGWDMVKWVGRLFIDRLRKIPILTTTSRMREVPTKDALQQVPKGLFARFAILDFILGEVDRKPSNWMIVKLPEKNENEPQRVVATVSRFLKYEQGTAIVAIDGDAAHPKGRPLLGETKNQYLWAEFSIANETIPPEIKEELRIQTDPDSWDEGIVNDLIDEMLLEDIPDKNHETRKDVKAIIHTLVDKVIPNLTPEGRIKKMPTLEELQAVLIKRDDFPSELRTKKIIKNIAKTILQAITAKERIQIFNCFLNPPKGSEDKFTLKLLGSIRTEDEIQAFWKFYDSAVKKAATN